MPQPPWFTPVMQAIAPYPQLMALAQTTEHPSLPKALRHMREANLTIDNSCFLYPLMELPLKELLVALLSRHLASGRELLLPLAQAEALADTISDYVHPESTWLSNARWGRHPQGYWAPTGGWKSFTQHPYDAGFIWMAPDSVGFIWAWADDVAPGSERGW